MFQCLFIRLDLDVSIDGCLTTYQVNFQDSPVKVLLSTWTNFLCNVFSVVWSRHLETTHSKPPSSQTAYQLQWCS